MDINEMLNIIMKKNHLSQEKMAKRYKVSPSQISRWVTGQAMPRGQTMILIYEDFKKIS